MRKAQVNKGLDSEAGNAWPQALSGRGNGVSKLQMFMDKIP